MMQNDLFSKSEPKIEALCDGVYLLRQFIEPELFYNQIMKMAKISPFRRMMTPGGKIMNIAITNSGDVGWYSDRKGYRYLPLDPLNAKPWPPLADFMIKAAKQAAQKAGFKNYNPDTCLINCYQTGDRLTPHQDKNEQDFSQPIVSMSLGLSAIFQLYEEVRGGKPKNILLDNGDVLVFGGPARRYFHAVKKLEKDNHTLTGSKRYNLTFRKAL